MKRYGGSIKSMLHDSFPNMFQPLPGISFSPSYIFQSLIDVAFLSLKCEIGMIWKFVVNFWGTLQIDMALIPWWLRIGDQRMDSWGLMGWVTIKREISMKWKPDNFLPSRGSNCWRNMEGVCDSCSIMPLLIIFRYRKASIHSITVSHLSLITGFSLLEQKETLAVLIVSRRQGKAAGVPGAEGGVIPNTPVNFCFRRTIG